MGCYFNDSNKRVLLLQLFCFIWWQKSRNPGFTWSFHCGITQYSLFLGSIQAIWKPVKRIPKALLSLGSGTLYILCIQLICKWKLWLEVRQLYNAEEDLKTKGRRVMIRGKDCALHNVLQVYNYLSLDLGV